MGGYIFKGFASVICSAYVLCAQSDEVVDNIAKEMSSFSREATQTRQNIDYMPYIMSVWSGEQLFKFGARTLKDALMLFPGVDISTDNIRNSSLIFRGSNPFAYGQSRLIIDGVTVNDRTFDGYSAYLDMPIELIKRIEVVRGPGSFAEGTNGYAGTINIATNAEKGSKDGGFGYLLGGSYGAHGAGAYYSKNLSEWHFYIDAYKYKDSSKVATGGMDGLNYSPINSALSRSGYANTALDTSAVYLSVANDSLTLSGRFTNYEIGSAFGNLYALPNNEGRQKMPSWYLEAKYKKDITKDLSVEAKGGYMEDGWSSYARSYPPGMKIAGVTFVDGYWADLELKNKIAYGGASFKYSGLEDHSLSAGIYRSLEKNILVRSITTNRSTGSGWMDYSLSAPFFDGSAAKRGTTKIYISDRWEFSDSLAFSFDASSANADDFERQNDYRLATVWQLNDEDILKFMISTAYRAPAWQELYAMNNPARVGNRSLKPERVRAYEMEYIKKLDYKDSFSINLFYLQNKNQINKLNSDNQYRNSCDSTIYGGELEYKKRVDPLMLYLGYSYIIGDNSETGSLASAASNMLKGGVLGELGSGFSIGAMMIYVGDKKRAVGDNRSDTHSYLTLDLALNYNNKRWGVQVGAKNIADAAVTYPSERNTYVADYPIGGRSLYVKLFSRF